MKSFLIVALRKFINIYARNAVDFQNNVKNIIFDNLRVAITSYRITICLAVGSWFTLRSRIFGGLL